MARTSGFAGNERPVAKAGRDRLVTVEGGLPCCAVVCGKYEVFGGCLSVVVGSGGGGPPDCGGGGAVRNPGPSSARCRGCSHTRLCPSCKHHRDGPRPGAGSSCPAAGKDGWVRLCLECAPSGSGCSLALGAKGGQWAQLCSLLLVCACLCVQARVRVCLVCAGQRRS
jgi:hypothetical protein